MADMICKILKSGLSQDIKCARFYCNRFRVFQFSRGSNFSLPFNHASACDYSWQCMQPLLTYFIASMKEVIICMQFVYTAFCLSACQDLSQSCKQISIKFSKMGDGGGGNWLVRVVSVSASVNLPLHYKVQKFSSGTGSPPSDPRKRAIKRLWWWWFRKWFVFRHNH